MTKTKTKDDRTRRFTIEVTQEIINTAAVKDSSHCMIADALRASVPNAQRVAVDLQTIRWTDPTRGLRFVALTPATGQKALLEFDQEIKPEPFRLRVQPFQVIKSGSRTSSKRTVTPGQPTRSSVGTTGTTPPFIEGGDLPPVGALSNTRGRRRAFGLRLTVR